MNTINKIPVDRSSKILLYTIAFFALVASACYISVNFFMLSRGFSIWDEAYYLLSYKMAYKGFYPHFNNTPFVVATLFEWAHPGIIGYRLIHIFLAVFGASVLALSVIAYLDYAKFVLHKAEKFFIFLMAIVAAFYNCQTSVSTLSYNHLNEFFFLTSQALVILALSKESMDGKSKILIFVGGFLALLDVYIKPPSFIILCSEAFVLIFLLTKNKDNRKSYLFYYLMGLLSSLFFSFIFIMSPGNWSAYLSYMKTHTMHSPISTLISFLQTGYDMLKTAKFFIALSLAFVLYGVLPQIFRFEKTRMTKVLDAVLIALFVLIIYFIFKLLFPIEIWNSFSVHWWFWWVYASTIFLAIAVILFGTSLISVVAQSKLDQIKMTLILLILLTNPLALAVGTINGFGQVQMHIVSWFIGLAVALYIIFRNSRFYARIYSSFLILIMILISMGYFTRQISKGNFSGQGSLGELNFEVESGPLKGVKVDKETFEVLENVNKIISQYPSAPTVVFFDAPGFQYAFGREWIVADPWLTNYEEPMTKNDEYNCSAITQSPSAVKGAIFIVIRSKHISSDLSACLRRIGFPDDMKLLGKVETTVGSMTEPIQIYWNP